MIEPGYFFNFFDRNQNILQQMPKKLQELWAEIFDDIREVVVSAKNVGELHSNLIEFALEKYYPPPKKPRTLADLEKIMIAASKEYDKMAVELQKILNGGYMENPDEMEPDEYEEELEAQLEDFIEWLRADYDKWVADSFKQELDDIIKGDMVDRSYFDKIWDEIDLDELAATTADDILAAIYIYDKTFKYDLLKYVLGEAE